MVRKVEDDISSLLVYNARRAWVEGFHLLLGSCDGHEDLELFLDSLPSDRVQQIHSLMEWK